MTIQEREALKSLASNNSIVIQEADKGGRIVVMNRHDYIKECEKQLCNTSFYQKLDNDPNMEYASEVRHQADEMKQKNLISNNEHKFLTEHLDTGETPIFYGLPKIHKLFERFPPLRPIVSQMKSSTRHLSELLPVSEVPSSTNIFFHQGHKTIFTENWRNQQKPSTWKCRLSDYGRRVFVY